MTLTTEEFIRCFLLHVLPAGLHRIRHYGLLANTARKDNLARAGTADGQYIARGCGCTDEGCRGCTPA